MKKTGPSRRGGALVVLFVSMVQLGSAPIVCGSDESGSESPGQTYLSYSDALSSDDLRAARSYLASAKVYELIGQSDDDAIASLKVLDPIEGLEVVDESIDGDRATVTARGEAMGMTAVGTIEMVLEDGAWKVLSELWNLGADSEAESSVDGQASLHDAARAGDAEAVAAAISADADVDAQDDSGRTPLYWAANYDRAGVIELLVAAGADVDLATDGGETPLMIAASAGSPDAVALLVSSGAAVDSTDRSGRTALLCVAGMSDWTIDQMANGEAGAVRMIEALAEAGADVDYADPWQFRTALMEAALNGRTEMVRALLAAGADVNRSVSDDDGTTAVMEAAKSGSVDTFKVLADAGADLAGSDRTGRTVVDWAADHPEIVEILVAQGAEGAGEVTSSLDEMRCADDDPQPAVVRLKAKGYAEVSGSQFLNAAARGDSEAVMLFLRAGIPVNTKDEHDHSETALNRAVTNFQDPDAVFILLSCGADPNAGTIAPLIRVANNCDSADVVRALIDAGADPNTKALSGFSALQFADMSNCEENARILREAGAEEAE